jgi:predicted aldo/keto reductase-like oxidoreductase
MRLVELGSTGLMITEVGFGGIPIIRLDIATAVDVLRRAYEKGINFYDTANAYRGSEDKMGRAFEGMRHSVIFATKTLKRDAKSAAEQIENSLRLLRTDYIDLYQLHQVAQEKDWNAVTAHDGALEAVVRAKEQGKIRFIGVTSHSLPMAIKLVKTGLFSTIQFPFNFIEDAAKDELHIAAVERGMGILAMKPFGGGVIDNASVAFKFLRQYPEVIPIPGFDSVESVDEVVSIYGQENVVTQKDLELMDDYRIKLGNRFCRRCEYCMPCEQGVRITPGMNYNLVASRMSPAVSVEFARIPMESIKLCTACGACVERCPYELPIPKILKAHYDLYEAHRAEAGV